MATSKVPSRKRRLKWFQEARFGLFIHWGLYSQLGRHEWVMNQEQIPVAEYEKLADTWEPKPKPMREWCRLAVKAGMKYMVMTTKHHEGFCLWDTDETDYSAAKRGPKRDLVAEYVEACREAGLKVGFYYSLMDWHHPDGARCYHDEAARRRFVDFTRGCVRELMSNYGKIDILWYDVPWPLQTPEAWESAKMNRMARRLQPHILINNRSRLPEDFGTPEEHVTAAEPGRAWEACMTFNRSWGYMPISPDWRSVREVIGMLQTCAAGNGNLLLNVGPAPDGSVPPEATERLVPVGKWLAGHGEAVYGRVDRNDRRIRGTPLGAFSIKGKTAYWWVRCWPGREMAVGGFRSTLRRASLLASGKEIPFEQTKNRLVLKGLPQKSPDKVAGVAVVKLEFASKPRREQGPGCVVLKDENGNIV